MSKVMGERWTWAAICRASRLVIAWHVGKRDAAGADALVADVRARLSVMPQISTDGCALYVEPIGRHFGYGVDYAQMIKHVSNGGVPQRGEVLAERQGVDFIEKRVIFGAPDMGKVDHVRDRAEQPYQPDVELAHSCARRCASASAPTATTQPSPSATFTTNLCHVPQGHGPRRRRWRRT